MGDNNIYATESGTEKWKRKAKESPFFVVGLVGLIGAVGMGIHKYKNKGNMKTSVYLMQLRVVAQGTLIGSLTIGLLYSMTNDLLARMEKDKKK